MHASPENDTAEYIERRIKQALAHKTLRDLHKTLAGIEAEELAERKVLVKLALITLAILVGLSLYVALKNDPADAEQSRIEVIRLEPPTPAPRPPTPGQAE